MDSSEITGVILAGGKASRMGGRDKGLINFSGHPMIEYVITALRPQVGSLVINANRNIDEYNRYGYPVIQDGMEGYQGPLAGMASCLEHIATAYMLTLPCDSPYLPEDIVKRFAHAMENENADICTANNGERLQPVFSLMKSGLKDSLHEFLDSGGRKIDKWFEQHKLAVADFSDKPETFLNINSPEDIAELESRVYD